MAAELEQLGKEPRYAANQSRLKSLSELSDRYRSIKGFPNHVRGTLLFGGVGMLPLENLGWRIEKSGFRKEGLLLIRTSRRWEYEDGFVPVDDSIVVSDGDFTFRERENEVTIRGEKRILTPIENQLLACLARRPNVTVSKIEIIDEVWGTNRYERLYADRNLLYIGISSLRKKTEVNPRTPTRIITEVGRGYKFRVSANRQRGINGH